mmetsp:Transcript_20236/g.47923  ORF Transcript_20236/g.47923 Transcript_20236/m.47923 type:complete len:226 (+) Transcript_20236:124-801(+)
MLHILIAVGRHDSVIKEHGDAVTYAMCGEKSHDRVVHLWVCSREEERQEESGEGPTPKQLSFDIIRPPSHPELHSLPGPEDGHEEAEGKEGEDQGVDLHRNRSVRISEVLVSSASEVPNPLRRTKNGPGQDYHGKKQCNRQAQLQPHADNDEQDALKREPEDEHRKQGLQSQASLPMSLHEEGDAKAKEDRETHVMIRSIHWDGEHEVVWKRVRCEEVEETKAHA